MTSYHGMIKMMRWLTSWVLYWLGDVIWRVTLLIDSEFLGMAYQKVMASAYRIQGDGDGPWQRPPEARSRWRKSDNAIGTNHDRRLRTRRLGDTRALRPEIDD